jgi:hypothetical protein
MSLELSAYERFQNAYKMAGANQDEHAVLAIMRLLKNVKSKAGDGAPSDELCYKALDETLGWTQTEYDVADRMGKGDKLFSLAKQIAALKALQPKKISDIDWSDVMKNMIGKGLKDNVDELYRRLNIDSTAPDDSFVKEIISRLFADEPGAAQIFLSWITNHNRLELYALYVQWLKQKKAKEAKEELPDELPPPKRLDV